MRAKTLLGLTQTALKLYCCEVLSYFCPCSQTLSGAKFKSNSKAEEMSRQLNMDTTSWFSQTYCNKCKPKNKEDLESAVLENKFTL